MAFDYKDSLNFHRDPAFRIAEAIPGVATISALVRLIGSITFIAANVLSSCFSRLEDLAKGRPNVNAMDINDCFGGGGAYAAIGHNFTMIFDSLITAIPIVGNIQSWIWTYHVYLA